MKSNQMNHRSQMIERFNRIYLGDSVLQRIEVGLVEGSCVLIFHAGKVLKDEPNATIFEPAQSFAPARLILTGARSLWCEGGQFNLHSTVVDFGAKEGEGPDDAIFSFQLTGGSDPNSFVIWIRIRATNFSFDGTNVALP